MKKSVAYKEMVCAPSVILQTVCEPVKEITQEIKDLAHHMFEVMYATDGCGLAAPQIGKNIRLVVIDCEWGEGSRKKPYVLVNPKIVVADEADRSMSEGCLSYPGILVPVKRPSHVICEALNLDGDLIRYEARGNLLAACLQHECDHLQGVTIPDHLPLHKKMEKLEEYKHALEVGARPGEVEI